MKFSSSALVITAAAASAVLAAPQAANPHATASGHATTSGIQPHASASGAAHDPHAPATKSDAHATTSAPAAHSTAAQEPDINIPYGPSNALWKLQPADPTAWAVIDAPGVFNVTAHFAIKDQDKVIATFAAPQPYVGFEFWGYQRSDGGMYALLIDGVSVGPIDVYNKTAGQNDPPVLLYKNNHLERKHHLVQLRNLVDSRVHKAGQFNIDHVVITAAADAPRTDTEPTQPAPTQPSTVIAAPVPSSDPVPPSQPDNSPPPPSDPTTPGNGETQAPGSARALSAPLALLVAGLALLL